MDSGVLCKTILFFFIYSCMGWVCECIYCSIPARKFINRGFLTGPLCPVYGFGALLVIWMLTPVSSDVGMLFIFGLLVTSALEYITSLLLEKLFHMKWWDYSTKHCNIHGRVCLLNSVLFGILSVLLMRGIHPPIRRLVNTFSPTVLFIATYTLCGILLLDLIVSVHATLQLNGKLKQLHSVLEEIQEKSAQHRLDFGEKLAKLRERQFALEHHHVFSHRRLLRAFPHLKSTRYHEEAVRLRQALNETWVKSKNKVKSAYHYKRR